MRPAGMSSDEDFEDEDDDIYFSVSSIKRNNERNRISVEEALSDVDGGLREYLDNANKNAAFHKAAESCDFETMRNLLDNGVAVDNAEITEWTPLMKACSRGRYEVVEFLLQNGANPNIHKELFTPLMACCIPSYVSEEDRLMCVRLLIDHGANINATDKYKSSALITAVSNGLETIANELLSRPEINVDQKDKEGWNALFYAINNNYKSLAEKLINAGIDLNAVSEDSEFTALQLAEYKDRYDIIKLLKPEEELSTPEKNPFKIKDPLSHFINELPDENGLGGFSSDVRDIFLGLGYQRLYDRLQINVGLADFLVMSDDLDKLGIKLEPLRKKILVEGIHRFHVFPWKKDSLYYFQRPVEFRLEDCINAIANVTKHLTILYATLNYMKIRLPKREKGEGSVDKEIIRTLIDCYGENRKLHQTLTSILEHVKTVKSAGEVEADFVRGKRKKSGKYRYFWILTGTIIAAVAMFCRKLR